MRSVEMMSVRRRQRLMAAGGLRCKGGGDADNAGIKQTVSSLRKSFGRSLRNGELGQSIRIHCTDRVDISLILLITMYRIFVILLSTFFITEIICWRLSKYLRNHILVTELCDFFVHKFHCYRILSSKTTTFNFIQN